MFAVQTIETRGITRSALRWGEKKGKWRQIVRGVYGEGPQAPSDLDMAVAKVVKSGAVARGRAAGVLHGLDSVEVAGPEARSRRTPIDESVVLVDGVRVASGLQTLFDLASVLGDDQWEQALESALRSRLVTLEQIDGELARLGRSRPHGTARIRRVLARRLPAGAPATESLLETLMVQLARWVPGLPPPQRQVRVYTAHGTLVARVDLAWPELGLFLELDGEQHKDQPVYDARRETAVVAATGWLCGRFTWTEVTRVPRTTARRLAALVDQARRRPIAV